MVSSDRPTSSPRVVDRFLRPARLLAALLLLALGLGAAPGARALDLWPLAEFSEDRQMLLYPLYVHEGDFLMIFPFYYRTNEGRDQHIVWPLIKFSDGRLTRAMPVWYKGDGGTLTVFPLFRQTPDYTWWTVPPIYMRHDGDFTALWPLYARSPETLWVLPYYREAYGRDVQHLVWPLYRDHQTTDTRSINAPAWPLPLYTSYASESQRNFRALLYFQGHDGDAEQSSRWNGLFPVWYRAVATGKHPSTSTWLFPYWGERSPDEAEDLVLPLFYRSRKGQGDGASRDLWLLPYVSGQTPTSRYQGLLPLYFASRDTETEHGKQLTHRTFNLLWPVYRRQETREASGTLRSYNRRFLIFSDARLDDGSRVFRLLGIPVVERDNARHTPRQAQ